MQQASGGGYPSKQVIPAHNRKADEGFLRKVSGCEMSASYLDADTLDLCRDAIRAGRTLDTLAARLHIDSDRLARLLQMPVSEPVVTQHDYLWSVDRLDAVL